ncbi:Short-chain dehydrogenase/reductase SDR [Caballeronia hypogeia]|uniref:Short-chain dehydrogenase/reductase SDR n=1 Tax=Caballeronia hypogeia TaxID=1777140 RepID=A0A158CFS6_9BURK|nr:short chain dehydrogenase [Caballeronia hypogeia]SAK81120.1 Short-chain dehydrogenase/reductase SDR [Caballeronia hypogeia]
MKIILIGANGTIGAAIEARFSGRHELIRANRTAGDVRVDIADPHSIRQLYRTVGTFDALICAAGQVQYEAFEKLTIEHHAIGIRSKLMGQVALVTEGLQFVNDAGSFTLTSGLTNEDPIRQGASSALVNGALEGYVRGAAIEMPRGIRINVVSPTLIEESVPVFGPYFPGVKPVPASEVALAYVKSVEGAQTGRVLRVGWSREQ